MPESNGNPMYRKFNINPDDPIREMEYSIVAAYKTKGIVNPSPHNDTFWRPWETSLLKTLWEKEKLLVTINFSFSHSVFYLFG